MKILSFHLKGKMAHFRRYYSNSSALSYTIPPRTTIIGIVAGMLGYPRDSYYEAFSKDQCKVAVSVRAPIKKQIQKLNLLMVKSPNDLNGYQEFHSQTATELVLPQNIRNGFIDYQIWLAHRDPSVIDDLLSFTSGPGYVSKGISVALGTAQHLGWVEGGQALEGEANGEGLADIHSVIPSRKLHKIDFSNPVSEYRLYKEDMPVEFDKERKLIDKGNMIINVHSSPVRAHVSDFVRLSNGEIITWME
jgi:CRISPR-associated protein Cas5h